MIIIQKLLKRIIKKEILEEANRIAEEEENIFLAVEVEEEAITKQKMWAIINLKSKKKMAHA